MGPGFQPYSEAVFQVLPRSATLFFKPKYHISISLFFHRQKRRKKSTIIIIQFRNTEGTCVENLSQGPELASG